MHSTLCVNYLGYLEKVSGSVEAESVKGDLEKMGLITKMHRELEISLRKFGVRVVEEVARTLGEDLRGLYGGAEK